MAQAQILMPTSAEAYNYDHPIVGRLTATGPFDWNGHMVDTRRCREWTMVRIDADTAEQANRIARYQADRLASGMLLYYFQPATD